MHIERLFYHTTLVYHSVTFSVCKFDLEANFPTQCGYDRVKLCEPNCDKDRKHKTICGQDRPSDYVSEGETMALQFYSDGTVNRRGFKVQYQWECGQTLIGKCLC